MGNAARSRDGSRGWDGVIGGTGSLEFWSLWAFFEFIGKAGELFTGATQGSKRLFADAGDDFVVEVVDDAADFGFGFAAHGADAAREVFEWIWGIAVRHGYYSKTMVQYSGGLREKAIAAEVHVPRRLPRKKGGKASEYISKGVDESLRY